MATGHLIGNKIADTITSACRSKRDAIKTQQNNQTQEIHIPPEKRNQIIDDLRLI